MEGIAADIQGDNVDLTWLAVYFSVICVSDPVRQVTICYARLFSHVKSLDGHRQRSPALEGPEDARMRHGFVEVLLGVFTQAGIVCVESLWVSREDFLVDSPVHGVRPPCQASGIDVWSESEELLSRSAVSDAVQIDERFQGCLAGRIVPEIV